MNVIFLAILGLSLIVALTRGGPPERWGAVILLAMTAAELFGRALLGVRYGSLDPSALAVDVLGFFSFAAMALFCQRIWPLWAAPLQLLSCATHLIRALSLDVAPRAYWIMKSAPTLAICILLMSATLLHRRRLTKTGSDPSWRIWRRRTPRPDSLSRQARSSFSEPSSGS